MRIPLQSSISVFFDCIHATSRPESGRAIYRVNLAELEQQGTQTNTGGSTDTRDRQNTAMSSSEKLGARCAKFAC